jgi:hypothetical protein
LVCACGSDIDLSFVSKRHERLAALQLQQLSCGHTERKTRNGVHTEMSLELQEIELVDCITLPNQRGSKQLRHMLRSGVGSDGSIRDWSTGDESAGTGCLTAHMIRRTGDADGVKALGTAIAEIDSTAYQAQLRGWSLPRFIHQHR